MIKLLLFLFCILLLGHGVLHFCKRVFQIELRWSLSFVIGILVNYSLVMLTSFNYAMLISLPFILTGGLQLFRELKIGSLSEKKLFILIYVGLFLKNFSTIIGSWDARSIWFFHAKMFFYNGGFEKNAGWLNEGYRFSHPYYPKLLPLLSGHAAHIIGFWNEYLPSFSLIILMSAVFLVVTSLQFQRKLQLGLVFIIFGLGEKLIWDGYADAYCAAFSVLGVLCFWEGFKFKKNESIILGLSLFCMSALMKDEGLVIAGLSFLTSLVFFQRELIRFMKERSIIFFAGFNLFVYSIWFVLKKQMGLSSYLKINADSFERLANRVVDGETLFLILKNLGMEIALSVMLLFSIAGLCIWKHKKTIMKKTIIQLISIAIMYCGVLTIVYLLTPFDVSWQLSTSADRVSLIVKYLLVVGSMAHYAQNFEEKTLWNSSRSLE